MAVRVGRAGWESCVKMDRRVLEEICFWRQNLRSLNGWRMHEDDYVVYCKEGCIDMFLDALDFQLAGVLGYKV